MALSQRILGGPVPMNRKDEEKKKAGKEDEMVRLAHHMAALALLVAPAFPGLVTSATALELSSKERRVEATVTADDLSPPSLEAVDGKSPPRAAPIVWKPRVVGAPRERVGGAVRGSRAPATPLVLAPGNLALTLKASPSLFWHLDTPTPEGVKVVFTLIDENGEAPLVETELPAPNQPGIYRIRLSDYAVELESDRTYAWSIALVPDMSNRSRDRISQALILRTAASAGAPERATDFAARGLWYDALESLSDTIDAEPQDAGARAQRNSLLNQAGLVIDGS